MKKVSLLALGALSLGALAPSAHAQTAFGLGAGYDTELEAPFLSVQARTARGISFPVRINPEFQAFLKDEYQQFQGNLNVLYDFGVNNVSFTPYAGAGLGFGYSDDREKKSSIGANFLFGAEFGNSRARPYAQLQISTTRSTGAAIAGGILFGF